MNPTLLRVTNRIIERSRETRSAYLARINRPKPTPSIARSWPAVTWPRLCRLPAG
jgi:phosphogluconate dehydratase